MDPVSIATAVVTFLAPFLIEGGKAAAKKGGEALIAALERRFKDKPAAQEALDDVKNDPQDEDLQTVLRVQLKKALAADAGFLAELARLLEQARAEAEASAPASSATYQATVAGSGVAAQGEGAVGVRSVGGSVVTGGVKLDGGSTFVGGSQTGPKKDE